MAYGLQDVVLLRKLIDTSEGDDAHRRRLATHLDAMLALCETIECRREQLLGYFGEQAGACGNCDTCLSPPQAWDGTDGRAEAPVDRVAAATTSGIRSSAPARPSTSCWASRRPASPSTGTTR